MILGMSTATFTLLHVLISFVGIGSGLGVLYGMIRSRSVSSVTLIFLLTTAATSLTGFAFPNDHVTPGMILGVLSMIVLAVAAVALYGLHLKGPWRAIYVVAAALALYFNVFVLIAQSFEKVPALHALAPTQKEPPFGIAQLAVLILFVVATVFALKRYRPGSLAAAAPPVISDKTRKRVA
jgi:hypothetical protein